MQISFYEPTLRYVLSTTKTTAAEDIIYVNRQINTLNWIINQRKNVNNNWWDYKPVNGSEEKQINKGEI